MIWPHICSSKATYFWKFLLVISVIVSSTSSVIPLREQLTNANLKMSKTPKIDSKTFHALRVIPSFHHCYRMVSNYIHYLSKSACFLGPAMSHSRLVPSSTLNITSSLLFTIFELSIFVTLMMNPLVQDPILRSALLTVTKDICWF